VDIWSVAWSLVGFVIGASAGFFYTQFAMRPKLRCSGGGGGGQPPVVTLRVTSDLGWHGFALGGTMLVGRQIWERRPWGVQYERHPIDVTAMIRRTDGPRIGGEGLYLRLDGSLEVTNTVRIPSGKSATVFALAGHPSGGGKFFVFAPQDGSDRPQIPDESAAFTGPAEFEISVIPLYGGRAVRTQCALDQDMRGNWYWRVSLGKKGGTSSSFVCGP
jgi:hypothetical protein